MDTWVRIDGKINLNISNMFDSFNLSEYRHEDYVILKQKIESIVQRSYHQDLDCGFDTYCGVTFDDKCCHRSNYLYLTDTVDPNKKHYVTSYDSCVLYLNVWSRSGSYEQGQQFVENMINSLKSNNCNVEHGTKIIVTADYTDKLSIYTGHDILEFNTNKS